MLTYEICYVRPMIGGRLRQVNYGNICISLFLLIIEVNMQHFEI